MGVPKQIRKQTEAVQQLYATLNGGADDDQPDGAVAAADAESVGSTSVPANVPADVHDQPEPNEPGTGDQDEETFAQKYRTLQGMFNSQVPTLTNQVRDLTQRLEQTQQLLASMTAAPAAVPAPSSNPAPQKSLLTDEERTEYGESIDVMRKVTQEMVSPYQAEIARLQRTIDDLQGQVVPRVDQLSRQQMQSAEQRFWSDLTVAVPNWQQINSSPDFQTWLLAVDPLTGLSRQTYLEDAQSKLDASRVIGFFTSWSATSGHAAQSTGPQASSELEKQVAPGRGRTAPAPQGDQKRTYTQKEVAAFYDDVRAGRFKGREDERGRVERDIFAAQAEGRIVQA